MAEAHACISSGRPPTQARVPRRSYWQLQTTSEDVLMAEKRITIRATRFDPEKDKAPRLQSYDIPFSDESMVVLDALNHIKAHVDGSLSYRWSCRMGICGSCGMMVNGTPKLTCNAFLRDYWPRSITVEPLQSFPIVRDLVIDMEDFMHKLKSIKPWIIRQQEYPLGAGEHRQTMEQIDEFRQFSECINCMLCYAACPVYGLNNEFLGPAAIALSRRYNLDSRDHRQAFLAALVARIEIVAAGKRDRRRAEKLVVQAVDGAGRVTEHAVDAFAELAELIDLLHRLAMLAGTERVLLLPDDPRFDGLQLVHEVLHVDDEVANDREVLERLDSDGSGPVVAEEGVAGELRGSVDHHPAAPADAHPARPPIAEAAVNVRLDVVERVQDHHALVREWNVIRLEARRLVLFGIEARGPDRDPLFRHQ